MPVHKWLELTGINIPTMNMRETIDISVVISFGKASKGTSRSAIYKIMFNMPVSQCLPRSYRLVNWCGEKFILARFDFRSFSIVEKRFRLTKWIDFSEKRRKSERSVESWKNLKVMSDLKQCCTNYKPRHARKIKSELKVMFKCITPVPKIFQYARQKKWKLVQDLRSEFLLGFELKDWQIFIKDYNGILWF